MPKLLDQIKGVLSEEDLSAMTKTPVPDEGSPSEDNVDELKKKQEDGKDIVDNPNAITEDQENPSKDNVDELVKKQEDGKDIVDQEDNLDDMDIDWETVELSEDAKDEYKKALSKWNYFRAKGKEGIKLTPEQLSSFKDAENTIKKFRASLKKEDAEGDAEDMELVIDDDLEDEEEMKKMKKEDYDPSSDLTAIFGETDLSEEFKEKVKTILSAAVLYNTNSLIKENYKTLKESFAKKLEKELDEIATKVELYTDTIVEGWQKDNALVLEHNSKSQIAESFMGGLKVLFEQHNIEIPEGKEDLFENMVQENESLDRQLNEQIETNTALMQKISLMKKESILKEMAEGLSKNEAEKLTGLAESVSFKDEEAYRKEVKVLKESCFKKDVKRGDINQDEKPVLINEEVRPKDIDDEVEITSNMISKLKFR